MFIKSSLSISFLVFVSYMILYIIDLHIGKRMVLKYPINIELLYFSSDKSHFTYLEVSSFGDYMLMSVKFS